MKHIYSSILLLLIIGIVIPNKSMAQKDNEYFKKYFGHAYTGNHGQYITIKAKDARGVVDSVMIVIDSNATFNLDTELGEVNLIDSAKKDLDLRIVRKNGKEGTEPQNDPNGLNLWLDNEFEKKQIYAISSDLDFETKKEFLPNYDILELYYYKINLGLNFTIELNAKYYPVKIYEGKSEFGSWMYPEDLIFIDKIDKNSKKIASNFHRDTEAPISHEDYPNFRVYFDTCESNEKNNYYLHFTEYYNPGTDIKNENNDLFNSKRPIELYPAKENGLKLELNRYFQFDNAITLADFSIVNIYGEIVDFKKAANFQDELIFETKKLAKGIYFIRNNVNNLVFKFLIKE